MELTVLVGEWLKPIPEFELARGFTPNIVHGHAEKLATCR
jgi:hypothetical protein